MSNEIADVSGLLNRAGGDVQSALKIYQTERAEQGETAQANAELQTRVSQLTAELDALKKSAEGKPETEVPTSRGRGRFSSKGAQLTSKLSASGVSALSKLESWRSRSTAEPSIESVLSGDNGKYQVINTRSMRNFDQVVGTSMVLTAALKDDDEPKKVAAWTLKMLAKLATKSVPIPESGRYAKTYTSLVADAKKYLISQGVKDVTDEMAAVFSDQPGLLRSYFYKDDNGLFDAFGYSDGHGLDENLEAATKAETMVYLGDNRHLGGIVEEAYQALRRHVYEDVLERKIRRSQIRYGKDAPPYLWGHELRHSFQGTAQFFTCLWQDSGEKRFSDWADECWKLWYMTWLEFPLPDGRTGMGGPHYVLDLQKRKGYKPDPTPNWHNSVYLETTMLRMWKAAAWSQAPVTKKHLEQTGNLLYHTLFKWGWDGEEADWKIAGTMGGGGRVAPESQRRGYEIGGKMYDAPFYILGSDGGVEDYDAFISVHRGHTLIAAPYSDIPDYEQKIKDSVKGITSRRGSPYLTLAMFDFRRDGLLP